MKILVIAEKPSVGRDIARVLGCKNKINGGMEGSNYVVTWALGHLVTLCAPESYDQKYKEWKMEQLPMMPEQFEIEVIRQTAKQYQAIKTLLYRKDLSQIVIATDAGREGELVARWILKKANCRKPCKRLWISSVTDKAIREGFAHLRNAKEYDHLYEAAQSRAEADWLVGINGTRALTCKYNAQLSCGRVQTPTLAMIASREEEIRQFQPKSYYGLKAEAEGISFIWKDEKSGSYSTFSLEKREAVYQKLKGQSFRIRHIGTKKKKSSSPSLYDLTELQREANRKFGYSAKETLNIMQRLYETHKVLTYPRTDSRFLTSDIVGTIKERLSACAVGPYRPLTAVLMRKTITASSSFVNDAKVTDHHAIIPTEQSPDFTHMTTEDKKIYDLVVRRFLAVLYPPCEYEETTLQAECAGEFFYARGNVILSEGWKKIYEQADKEEEETESLPEQRLPKLTQGKSFSNIVFQKTEGKTKPPARFTEATLLSAMENPVRYMKSNDRQMVQTMGETGGLGTVATRADIIEKLFSSFLIEKNGKELKVTSKGRQLLQLVPEELKKPEMTADWEMKLSKIAKGQLQSSQFMKEIRNYAVDVVQEIKMGEGNYHHENLTSKTCPDCGKKLLAVNGKNAKMLVCQNRECGYRETISRTSNARCPVCHKKMELIGKGENQTFVCGCGHKEKLSKFQERRQKEGAGVSKRDVANYMKKQKEDSKNNPFADALKNIKIN